jgi:ribosomal-protein-alanine N-acetyltransferase
MNVDNTEMLAACTIAPEKYQLLFQRVASLIRLPCPFRKPRLQKKRQNTTLLSMPAPVEHRIAALEARDADAVSALESACFIRAFTPEQYRRLLQTPPQGGDARFLGLGLFAPGRVLLAYVLAGLHRAAREAEVYNLAVRGSVRRRGFGVTLLTGALRALEDAGIEHILLEVREGNRPALALYASQGFEPCGRRRGYYVDTGEDALVLHLCTARNRIGQRYDASWKRHTSSNARSVRS